MLSDLMRHVPLIPRKWNEPGLRSGDKLLPGNSEAGQDICEHCGEVYTAYTHMETCSSGYCRVITVLETVAWRKDDEVLRFAHGCEKCVG